MTGQEIAVYLIVLLAVAWLVRRWFRRRRAATCCGESGCPASRRMAERLQEAMRTRRP